MTALTKHRIVPRYFALALGLLGIGMFGVHDTAAAYSVVYRFAVNNDNDGYFPYQLTGSGSTLYGVVTGLGSYSGYDAIFQLDATTGAESIVQSLNGANNVGTNPTGMLVDGRLYALTGDGGRGCGCGTLFSLIPGKDPNLLASFKAADGRAPFVYPIAIGQGFLAIAGEGGSAGCNGDGCGTAFVLTPPSQGGGWSQTKVHAFQGTDGSYPWFLLDTEFGIFGTTWTGGNLGGCNSGCGVVFQLMPPDANHAKWREATIYAFQGGADGGAPSYITPDAEGDLYGVTLGSGEAPSTIFELTPGKHGAAWKYTVLHTFGDPAKEGAFPGTLINVDGDRGPDLVGVAEAGGRNSAVEGQCGNGCGATFELTPGHKDWNYKVTHYFTGGTDGAVPHRTLIQTGGGVYGITVTGGVAGSDCCGTVFKLK